ncbi:MAG TPA: isoprenylcysteine carboxylmethyltransferase family protein [Terriglobales bacterium]|nr:isoprenylcysteine carboxylmethyltransferase family protein [Terriglobales bacterium]
MARIFAILKTLVFTVVVPGTVAGYVPYRLLGSRTNPVLDVFGVPGIIAVALGAVGYFICAWNFAYHGLGTPAPIDPPKTLIVRGLNRYVRNPMYVSVLLVVLGEAAVFHAPKLIFYAAVIWSCAHLFVVLYEEPTLHKKFGPSYEQYRTSVPRWIPRFNPQPGISSRP